MGWRKKRDEDVLGEAEKIPENTPISDAVKMADEAEVLSPDDQRRRTLFRELDEIEHAAREIAVAVHRSGMPASRWIGAIVEHVSKIAGSAERLRDLVSSGRTLSDSGTPETP